MNNGLKDEVHITVIARSQRSGSSYRIPKRDEEEEHDAQIEITINGNGVPAGKITHSTRAGQVVTTVTIDPVSFHQQLPDEMVEALITIPILSEDTEVAIASLDGHTFNTLRKHAAIIELMTQHAAYKLPAAQIELDTIAAPLHSEVGTSESSAEWEDVEIQIEIALLDPKTLEKVEQAMEQQSLSAVAPPLEFKVTVFHPDETFEIRQFQTYVERRIFLHADLDPSHITTAIAIEADGTVRHVPTKTTEINGHMRRRFIA